MLIFDRRRNRDVGGRAGQSATELVSVREVTAGLSPMENSNAHFPLA